MNDKKTLLILLVMGVIIFGLGIAVSGNAERKTTYPLPTATPYITTTPVEDEYTSDEMRGYFVEGCLEEDSRQLSYCNCAYTKIESTMGKKLLLSESIDYDETGVMSETMKLHLSDAIAECMDLYILN